MGILVSTGRTKQVLTHLQWTKSDEFKPGHKTEVVRIMFNADWNNIALIGEDFRVNIKPETERGWLSLVEDIESQIESNKVKLFLVDMSDPENREYECKVETEPLERKRSDKTWEHSRGRTDWRLTKKK